MRIASQLWLTLSVGSLAFVVALFFHDYMWWPADDGVFGFWAEAVLEGKLIGRDFYEIHGGYLTLLNALLFKWFGVDAVVLRYPLILLSAIQAMMIVWMLRAKGGGLMLLGGLLSITLGFIVAPNPSPVWYALFLAVAVIFVLTECQLRTQTFFVVGMLIGLCFMIRHPNAVFLGMGVLAYLLYQSRSDTPKRFDWLARGVLVLMALLLLVYSKLVFEPFAFLILALPPLGFLWLLFRQPGFRDEWVRPLFVILGGASLLVLPMVVFQLWQGNLVNWVQTSYLSSSDIQSLPFFHETSYIGLLKERFFGISTAAWAYTVCAFGLVVVLVYAPFAAGCTVLRRFKDSQLTPLAVIAVFFGMVSFYYQTVFYLMGSAVLFFWFLLETFPESGWRRKLGIGATVFTVFWMFILYAQGMVAWVFPDSYQEPDIPRTSVYYESVYEGMSEVFVLTEQYSNVGDVVFAYPQEPYFYFNLERENPFPFPGTSRFVVTEEELLGVQAAILANPPQLIIHNNGNKYSGFVEERLTAWVLEQEIYQEMPGANDFRFFVHTGGENLVSSPHATDNSAR